jgi:hypothetical protein
MGKKKKSKGAAQKKPRKDEDSDIMHDEVDDCARSFSALAP